MRIHLKKKKIKKFEHSCWQAPDKILLGGPRGASTPWELHWQALPSPRHWTGSSEMLLWARANLCWGKEVTLENDGLQERWKNDFCLSYSSTALNVVFPFYVWDRYLWSLLNSGIFYAQTEILETCIYDVWFETEHTLFCVRDFRVWSVPCLFFHTRHSTLP